MLIRDGDEPLIDADMYGIHGHELVVYVDKKPVSQEAALDIFWYTMKKYAVLGGFPGFYLDVKTGLICDNRRYAPAGFVETIWSKNESLEMFLVKIDLM